MRWNLALALLVGVTALAPAACGSGGADDVGVGVGGTRTITDAQGTEVEVPAQPRRVVALSEPLLDGALAVGLRPVATAGGPDGISPYLAGQAKGVPSVGVAGRPNVEYVATLEPDLILVDGTAARDPSALGELRRLAPTVYVAKAGQDWRSAFRATAAAINREREAAHLLREFDARVAEVRAARGGNRGARVGVVRPNGGGPSSAPLDDRAAGDVLEDLGLTARSDGDRLLLGAPGADLKAARQHRVVAVDGSAWTSAGGPIAARTVLDDVARALAARAPTSG